MARVKYFETEAGVKEEGKEWSPTVKLILALVLGFLLLSPVILGIYWLPK